MKSCRAQCPTCRKPFDKREGKGVFPLYFHIERKALGELDAEVEAEGLGLGLGAGLGVGQPEGGGGAGAAGGDAAAGGGSSSAAAPADTLKLKVSDVHVHCEPRADRALVAIACCGGAVTQRASGIWDLMVPTSLSVAAHQTDANEGVPRPRLVSQAAGGGAGEDMCRLSGGGPGAALGEGRCAGRCRACVWCRNGDRNPKKVRCRCDASCCLKVPVPLSHCGVDRRP